MKKRFLLLAVFALAMTGARADVAVNSNNFCDELLGIAQEADTDGNGVLSDAEIAEVTDIQMASGTHSIKGLEYFTNLKAFNLWYHGYEDPEGREEEGSETITSFDASRFPNLETVTFQSCFGLTSLDFSKNTKLDFFKLENCINITSFQLPNTIGGLELVTMPQIKAIDFKQFKNLVHLGLEDVNISDVDCEGMTNLYDITILGSYIEDEPAFPLNSLNVSGCTSLGVLNIWKATIKTVNLKGLPVLGTISIQESQLEDITVDDCGARWITVNDNHIDNFTIRNCPEMEQELDCRNNELKVLLLDNLPKLPNVYCSNNQLMFLDLSGMVCPYDGALGTFNGDDQHPVATAWKLSPTEVGLKAHDRMDPARMLNLVANGKKVTAVEKTVDGIRYIVFYDNGANADNLVGNTTTYEYETKWPYEWGELNSKDNNLPVCLNINKVDKPASFIKLSSTATLKTEVGGTLVAPTVTPSDGYIETGGKLTWKSSDESVVKVDAEGKLTVVGPGTATITVSGTATDYRYAPESVSYPVAIYALGDVNWDGKIDIVDVTSVISHILGQTPDGFHAAAADVNGDKKVDIVDVTSIIDQILNTK